MTDLAKILLLKGLDSQDAKDYFQQTFEAIKGKELKLEYTSFNGILQKKEYHSTIKITDIDDMREQINDIVESLEMEKVFGIEEEAG